MSLQVYRKTSFMLSFLEQNVKKCQRVVKETYFNALRPIRKDQQESCEIRHRQPRFCNRKQQKIFPLLGCSPIQERRTKLKVKNYVIEISKANLIPTSTTRRKNNFQVHYSKLESHKN